MRHKYFKILLSVIALCSSISLSSPLTYAQTPTEQAATGTVQVEGSEQSVVDLLCTPGDEATSSAYGCVNKITRVGIVIAIFIAVAMIIFAGYLYMSGEEKKAKTAKKIIIGVGVGVIILLFSYLILQSINPDLLKPQELTVPIDTSKVTCSITTEGNKCIAAPNLDFAMGGNTNISYSANGKASGSLGLTCDGGSIVSLQGTGVPAASGVKACSIIVDSLKQLKAITGNLPWRATSGFSSAHQSKAHTVHGTAMDVGFEPKDRTSENWSKLCQAILTLGNVRVLNEVSSVQVNGCPKYVQTKKRSGDHIHIQFLK